MKKALSYSLCVIFFSWAVYYGATILWKDVFVPGSAPLFLFKSAYMLFPMLVALVLQAIRHERPASTGLLRFRFSWPLLASIGCVIAVVLLSIPFSALVPGVSLHYGAEQYISMNGLEGAAADAIRAQLQALPAPMMILTTILSGVFAGCTINALFAFGEEYGWRNYMVSALKGESFLKAAAVIGLVWGIWHAPLVLAGHNYPQHPVAGVAMMCVFCVLVGIIELYFTLRTRSVITAAIIHGNINAMASVVVMFVLGGNDLTIGLTGLGGFLALGLAILVIRFFDRRSGRNIMTSAIDY
ncbi:MAG: CPBP family intramembrane glutamic endopeptidase [Candidatus Cryptobacteroides sp.]